MDVIVICGVQKACKGNEAVGDLIITNDDGEFKIPCCRECADDLTESE